MTRILCVCIALLAALPVQARMYQWVNPHTGRTQISGKPPAWYRGEQPGPRVFVFENGRLIDDTAKPLSEEERTAARDAAFASSRAATATAVEPGADEIIGESGVPTGSTLERGFGEGETLQPPAAAEAPDETIARLKGIIDAWEQQRTEEARRLLERNAVVPPGAEETQRPEMPPTAAKTPIQPDTATNR
ncbi:MAG: hypothetical protein ACT4NU_13625 [Chromatiales bacterium]